MASPGGTARVAVVETGKCHVSGYDLPEKRTSDEQGAMTPTERVRKHRGKLHSQQRRRLEVCVDMSLIETITRIARGYDVPLSSIVQKALEVYVVDYRKLAAEGRLLDEERAQICWREQAEAYNRKLADFNQRLARLVPSDGSSVG